MADRASVTVIHRALAPYRLDIFNALDAAFNLKLYFIYDSLGNQRLDRGEMQARLTPQATYLSGGIDIFGRKLPWQIFSVLIRARGGLVIVSEFSPVACLALLAKPFNRTKVIIWTDDNVHSVRAESKSRAWVRKIASKFADALILVGHEARQLYPTFNGRVAVLPIIQDETSSHAGNGKLPSRAKELAEHYGLSRSKVILYVGRLAPEKRVDRLVIAFAALLHQHGALQLLLVGDGPEKAALQKLVAGLGIQNHVIFAGQQEGMSLWAWFRLGSVFCLPSEQETFGAVVGEALISGMPVVCSHVAGAAELIVPGHNGFVVNATKKTELVAALNFWLEKVVAHDGLFLTRPTLLQTSFTEVADGLIKMLRQLYSENALAERSGELSGKRNSLKTAGSVLEDGVRYPKERRRRVALLQRRLTHYRVPFFEQLRAKLNDCNVDLELWHGQPNDEQSQREDNGVLPWANLLRTTYIFGSHVCWHSLPKSLSSADLVICPHESGVVLSHRLLFGRRHGKFAFWGHGRNFQASRLRISEWIKRWEAPKADWWFAYTALSRDHLIGIGVAPTNVTVVNNSVAKISGGFPPSQIRGKRRAVFLGTLSKEKHFAFLIRACDEVVRIFEDFELVIVGAGPEMDEIVALAASRSWIRVLGPLVGAEKARVLSDSDVMVCPGLVGLNIVDAFHAELPLITTRAPFHSPEIEYLEAGVNGIATEFDEHAFAAALIGVFSDESLLLSLQRGARSTGESLTLTNMVCRFASGILDCLEQNESPSKNPRRS